MSGHCLTREAKKTRPVMTRTTTKHKEEIANIRDRILRTFLQNYRNHDTKRIIEAMDYADLLHRGQLRRNGKPYILHPLAVALMAAEAKLDEICLIIALLHDTIEDTVASKESITRKFNANIAKLVEALTKIRTYSHERSVVDKQGTYQRILEASSKDIRTLLIKILDRVGNMHDMEHMPEEHRKRVSQETIDIYVPLARRLGVSCFECELANLSLMYLFPKEVATIEERKKADREEHEGDFKEAEERIQKLCREQGIEAEIDFAWPDALDFYNSKDGTLNQNAELTIHHHIFVDSQIQIYTVLGILHRIFTPVPNALLDMIASPKANGYRALETRVIVGGRIHRFSLLTHEMNEVNELGIIHNWKVNQNRLSSYYTNYMRLLGELTADEDARVSDVLDQSNVDGVYVYSPRKDIYFLPFESTVLDFAYEVHEKLGHRAQKAIINGIEKSIETKLNSGDVVEIIKGEETRPGKNWDKIAVTPKAKSSIKKWHKRELEKRSIDLGREMFFFELEKYGRDPNIVTQGEDFKRILGNEDLSLEKFYHHIWERDIIASDFITQYGIVSKNRVLKQKKAEKASIRKKIFSSLKSKREPACRLTKDDIFINFAQCCKPIIGDNVVGIVGEGKGIMVHRQSCRNIKDIPEERLTEVEWDMDEKVTTAVLNLQVRDEPGVLAKSLRAIQRFGINIAEFSATTVFLDNGREAILRLRLDISNRKELLRVVNEIRKIDAIISITHEE